MNSLHLSAPVKKKSLLVRVLPWMSSVLLTCALLMLILMVKIPSDRQADTLTVRNVDVAAPPPPEPPPPIVQQQQASSSPNPSMDLLGTGGGAPMTYSANPSLSLDNLVRVEKPEFDSDKFDLSSNLSVDFPMVEVKELDSVPRLLSNNRIAFPRQMRERGIDRVTTKVEIIIDQQGKAYVKKIIDPVYPEMVDVIRKAINDSRFTIPTKNGRPVQAIYLYTLVFINRT